LGGGVGGGGGGWGGGLETGIIARRRRMPVAEYIDAIV
jgi:hypothetical protein